MKKQKKVVAITGGCGRIGSALAEDLLKLGYKVLLGDVNKSKLLKIKRKAKSTDIEVFAADLTVKKNIDRFISFGQKKFKKIDSAVCCAYPMSEGWGSKFENLEEKFLKQDLYNQLGATIIFSQRIMRHFLKLKKGNLILISSIQGIQAPKFEHYKRIVLLNILLLNLE